MKQKVRKTTTKIAILLAAGTIIGMVILETVLYAGEIGIWLT